MQKEEIVNILKEAYMPLVDVLVNNTYNIVDKIMNSLPDNMSEESKLESIKQYIDNIADGLSSSFSLIKPEDIVKQMKEDK